jgi:hypothetical protein
MFDFYLAINLTAHTFSLKKESLRFPTVRRIFSVFCILPLFMILIVVNNLFMLLDSIIFPGFRKIKLNHTCFIVGVPRSATTYLFNILAKDKENFTCFKLWEIILAPSIIQKYILLGVIKIDRLLGRPLYRLSLSFDKVALGKIAKLHEISLSKPEEDEMLFIYTFASIYLSYFFPDVHSLNAHLYFDENVPSKKRKRLMNFYKRCIQRHVYVFNRNSQKIFLSKNPSFVSKTVSIAETFPKAKLIYMLRSPLKTIPSTISLNLNVYSIFSGKKTLNPLAEKTTETIIQWYKMADDSLQRYWSDRSVVVPFKNITGRPRDTVTGIYYFLDRIPGDPIIQILKTEEADSKNYKTTHKYSNSEAEEKEIPLRLDFIFNGTHRNEI